MPETMERRSKPRETRCVYLSGGGKKLKKASRGKAGCLLVSKGRGKSAATVLRRKLVRLLSTSDRSSTWITQQKTDADLASAIADVVRRAPASRRRFGRLLMLGPPASEAELPLLRGAFDDLIGGLPSFRFLPEDELLEVIGLPLKDRRDLIIGGAIDSTDESNGVAVFARGDLSRLIVPLRVFRPSGTCAPRFDQLFFADYGHTIRFGRYEAGTDAVLYEADPDYRRQIKKQNIETAAGLGASIRRLRLQRGLRRRDFGDLSEKTLARIERGEVETPHARTLRRICKHLGVRDREELETF